ncbi:unnamed protein product [Diatraea saccharalis]|uniref:Uncharacterized protein n=1 Tax=Diatraea saccharalis TaxID=40085 RepID=A0A9N9R6M6_9NEOP|nr:unnamed protein product [Diatraea saccharalis]
MARRRLTAYYIRSRYSIPFFMSKGKMRYALSRLPDRALEGVLNSPPMRVRELPETSIGGVVRAPRLTLSDCILQGSAPADALEAVLRKVQFRRLEIDHAALDDEGAVKLSELEVSEGPLEASHAPVLARALRPLACRLRALCLQRVSLSGEPLLCLVIALKTNSSVRELRLGDNRLTASDASHIASLLRLNTRLQLLDLSNNQIQDAGAGHIFNALVEQAALSPPAPDPASFTKGRYDHTHDHSESNYTHDHSESSNSHDHMSRKPLTITVSRTTLMITVSRKTLTITVSRTTLKITVSRTKLTITLSRTTLTITVSRTTLTITVSGTTLTITVSRIIKGSKEVGGYEASGVAFLVLWNNQLTRNCSVHLSKALRLKTVLDEWALVPYIKKVGVYIAARWRNGYAPKLE